MIHVGNAEQYIAKIIFRNRIFEYSGQQFEDFFVSIMTKYNSNFQPVNAYGNFGDGKNDGFDQTTGTYYQVFGPEDISKAKTVNDGVKKLKSDFEGLYKHWNGICPIKQFFFVINDKYKGLPVPIIKMAIELDNTYKNVCIKTFLTKDLENIFNRLNESAKQDIVGFIPDETMSIIGFDALNEVVSYLLKTELLETFADSLVVPDFDGKILFNGLSDIVNHRLVVGSYQEALLEQYFNDNPGVREILQKRFRALYEQAKNDIPETGVDFADSRFFYILDHACPKRTMPLQTSVLVLMAYYFSSCDIFEEPH